METRNPSTEITISTVLGAEIPSPIGTHFYLATTTGEDAETFVLGAYQKYEDAEKAVIVDITKNWREVNVYPWDAQGNPLSPEFKEPLFTKNPINATYTPELEKAYLQSHTAEDVIDWARRAMFIPYEVTKVKISRPIENVQTAMLDPISLQ